ncbi:MAG: hypothetical protein H7Z11_16970 [Verrucomicrobia bacterium]|nr:hypothetical protein [Leptolyngbya sp. ES-bin-22]
MSMKTTDRPIYHDYIESDAWRSLHPEFLKRANHRCAAMPWVKLKHYRCHHLHYNNLGQECYWIDVLCLSPFVHDVIIHKWLSGGKRTKHQKHYPNAPQRLFHQWCRLPAFIKLTVVCFCLSLLGMLFAQLIGVNPIVGGVLGAIVFTVLLM